MATLFIGGEADGERRDVDENHSIVVMCLPPKDRSKVIPLEDFEASEEVMTQTYRRHVIRTEPGHHNHVFYVWERVPFHEAVKRLLTFYNP